MSYQEEVKWLQRERQHFVSSIQSLEMRYLSDMWMSLKLDNLDLFQVEEILSIEKSKIVHVISNSKYLWKDINNFKLSYRLAYYKPKY
jgi:hypothetical protein